MFGFSFLTSSKSLASARLFYQDGSSDKEYHAAINRVAGGFTVTFAFGRRGCVLTKGTKTSSPVPQETAKQIYDRLIAEKKAKGYVPQTSSSLFTKLDKVSSTSGLYPQLLNSIDDETAQRHLNNDAWCLQEKFDGKRIMVFVRGGKAEGSNRMGQCVSSPHEVLDSLRNLPDCELDGELVGEEYMVFDLLKLDENNLRRSSYRVRYEVLVSLLGASFGPCVRVVETAWNTSEKRAFYERIAAAGGEGVVFKKVNSPSEAGRPASGGSQVKYKFYATCTCLVAAQNDQRSVRLSLLDEAGRTVGVGSVTIPSNRSVPQVGALVEVRYLYAYRVAHSTRLPFLGIGTILMYVTAFWVNSSLSIRLAVRPTRTEAMLRLWRQKKEKKTDGR